MANPYVFEFSALTGGASGALDSLNTTSLENASHAKVDTGSVVYFYVYNSTSTDTESSPDVIAPDTGSGRWLLSGSVSKADVRQNLFTNSGFGVWSNSTLENVGDQISVSDITAGVCTTSDTEGLAVGKLVEFGAGGSTADSVYRVTAVTANTNFTIHDTSITDATAVTCYEVTPGCVTASVIALDGWKKRQTTKIYREHKGDNTKDGSFYALKSVCGTAGVDHLYWPNNYDDETHVAKFAGRTVTLGCWVKTDVSDSVRISIHDGVSSTWSNYHTGGGAYEWLEVTKTVSTDVTVFRVHLFHTNSSEDDTAYWSQPMLVYGSAIGEGNYVQPPGEVVWFDKASVVLNDYEGVSVSTNVDIDIESQTNGIVPKGFKAVKCYIEGDCATAEKYINLESGDVGIYSQVANILNCDSGMARDYDNDGKIRLIRDDTFNDVTIRIMGVQVP